MRGRAELSRADDERSAGCVGKRLRLLYGLKLQTSPWTHTGNSAAALWKGMLNSSNLMESNEGGVCAGNAPSNETFDIGLRRKTGPRGLRVSPNCWHSITKIDRVRDKRRDAPSKTKPERISLSLSRRRIGMRRRERIN